MPSKSKNTATSKTRKSPRERKLVTLRFRCTTEQEDLLKAAAKDASLDLSNWLRSVALRAARAAVLPQK